MTLTSGSLPVLPPLPTSLSVHFLYSFRIPPTTETESLLFSQGPKPVVPLEGDLNQVLFLPRLHQIVQRSRCSSTHFQGPNHLRIALDLFLTNVASHQESDFQTYDADMNVHIRRISCDDLRTVTASGTPAICYVCGPPSMTEEFVGPLSEMIGSENVFYEKWW
jgi:hypothetical protein